MRDHWLPEAVNDLRIWSVVMAATSWTDDMLNMALEVIDRTAIAPSTIDHQVSAIAVDQPVIALRLARARLDRALLQAIQEAQANAGSTAASPEGTTLPEKLGSDLAMLARDPIRNLIENSGDWDSLPGVAETWPRETLNALWPWFEMGLRALDALKPRTHQIGYPLGLDLDFRFKGESTLELPEGALLGALRVATERLVVEHLDDFKQWVEQNSTVALTPAQRLIAHGIAQSPQALAGLGFDFIMGDDRRYFLGSIHDLHGTTKRLIAAISPFWTAEQVNLFEDHIRRFSPPPPTGETDPKDRMRWRHMIRRTRLDLLRA